MSSFALLSSSSRGAVLLRPAISPRTSFLAKLVTKRTLGLKPKSRFGNAQTVRVADYSDDTEESFVSVNSNDDMPLSDIKAALLDSLYGIERGLTARSEIRAEINELISQLEAKNPTPNPTEVLEAITGDWKLVYTSNSELMTVLALSKLPFVEVGDLTQKIDGEALTVENKVQLTVPFSRTSFSTTASFEVRSPKRLQLRLTKGGIQTPELMTDIELPANITVLGQALDLSQLKQALTPINDSVMGLLGQVNSMMSQAPGLQFNVPADRAQTWQLNTYVDDDTRIARGDGGSVFIYVREVSFKGEDSLLPPTAGLGL